MTDETRAITTLLDYSGVAVEVVETPNLALARRLARVGTRRRDVAYGTVVEEARILVYARGRMKLRIARPK